MGQIKKEITINASAKNIIKVIADFKNYPTFYPDVLKASVIRKTSKEIDVEFKIDLLITSTYTLRFRFHKLDIEWKMVEASSFVKKNNGEWIIEELAKNKSRVRFSTEIEFSWLVPKDTAMSLIEEHLPKMLKNLKKTAEAIK